MNLELLAGGLKAWLPRLFCLCHLVIAAPLLLSRLPQPFWWPVFTGLLMWVYLHLRGSRGVAVPSMMSRWLLSLGMGLVPLAVLRSAPWLSLIGIWLLAASMNAAARNRRGGPLPLTISLVWLLLAGLPPELSDVVWTSVLQGLNRFAVIQGVGAGGLVWLQGTGLMSSGRDFDVQFFCAGPWGLLGQLTFCWMLQAWRRTTLIQSVLVMLGAAGATVLVTIVAVAFAAQSVATNSALTEYPLLFWAGGFVIAVIGILGFDYSVFWLTAPIEDAARGDSPQQNPLAAFWNRRVSGWNAADSRPLEPLKPLNFTVLFREAFVAWRQSRNLPGLAPGLILLALLAAVLQSYFTSSRHPDTAVSVMRNRIEAMRREGQLQQVEHALLTLMSLRTGEAAYRLELADLLLETDRPDRARELLEIETATSHPPSATVSLWVGKNWLSDDRCLSLTADEVRTLLQQIPETDQAAAEAAVLLAKLSLRDGNLAEAQAFFARAAQADPLRIVDQLQLEVQYGLPQAEPLRYSRAMDTFRLQLNVPAAEFRNLRGLRLMQVLLGRSDAAFREFATDQQQFEPQQLRRLESEMRALKVRRCLASPTCLLLPAVTADLEKALLLAPDLAVVLETTVELALKHGLRLSKELRNQLSLVSDSSAVRAADLRRAAWYSVLSGEDQLGQQQLVQAETAGAELSVLEQCFVIRELRRSGRQAEAIDRMNGVLQQLQNQASLLARERLRRQVQVETSAGLLQEARSRCIGRTGLETEILLAELDLREFDERSGFPGELSRQLPFWLTEAGTELSQLLPLLNRAAGIAQLQPQAMQRLFAVWNRNPELQATADNFLALSRGNSAVDGTCLLLLGRLALDAGQTAAAVSWLESGLRMSGDAAAEFRGDLALALLRTAEPGRFAEAMRLIDRALLQSPDDLSLLLTKAELHLVLSELPKAQETLDRAARLAQEDPRVSALQSRLDVTESNVGLPLTSPLRSSPAQQGKSP
ncbi:MAG: tetratricopeptide repeat protein [Planctomycetaceae bacterium]